MNKKHLMKKIAVLFALLLVASLAVFPAPVLAGQTINQDKAMDFMKKVLHSNIDLSKYIITLKVDTTLSDVPPPVGHNVESLLYSLKSENNELSIMINIERGAITMFSIDLLEGQAITNKPYTNMYDAVTDFLKAYQAYTNIDSNNLIQMLNNVDLTKNSTITQESTKLTINSYEFGPDYLTNFKWEHIINDVAYTKVDITFYDTYLLSSMMDTRKLYTIGDTSINISMDKAIDIAIEGLKSYSYEMPDGSIVTDFKVSKENVFATLTTARFNYELRPYWDVRMLLDEVYPGNVFGLSAFIWANTGEIIEYGNMATGGISYPDGTNPTDSTSTPNATDNATSSNAPNSNTLIVGIAIVAVIAVVTAGILVTKKKQK